MRVRLRGINSVTKPARGWHAQNLLVCVEGRPALAWRAGTPQFIASYNEAVAQQAIARRPACS